MGLLQQASLVITPNAVKSGKLYAIKPTDGTGDLDVIRATTATRVDENGNIVDVPANVARIDYSNGSPAILVEPQRTNVHLNSSTMWNMPAFALSGGTVPTKSRELNITSPTGNNDAVVVVGGNGSTGTWGIYQVMTTVINSGQQVTVSVFAKAGSNNFIYLTHANISFTGTGGAYFNLSNGTTPTNGARIEDWGNGWYRCIMPTITLTANTSGAYNIGCYVVPSMSTNIWTTDYTGKSVYFFGIQVEVGSNATSYIPTTTSSVTRNADIISNTNASNLIGQTEGTIYIDANLQGQSFSDNASKVLCEITLNDTSQNRITLYRFNNLLYYDNIANNVIQSSGSPFFTITNFTGKIKIALVYQQNNVKVFFNGTLANTDTSALIPTCNNISIGNARYGAFWNGTINSAAIWKTKLSDQQAIQLTTL